MVEHGRVTNEERNWVWMAAGIAGLVMLLPYFMGFAAQGQDWRFSGFVFGLEDGNSYMADMHSGANGAWIFRSPYTPFPQNGVITFLPYLLLGKLAASPGMHEQLAALFHLLRTLAVILVFCATYDFLALFIQDVKLRRLATVLASVGSGLSWLFFHGGENWMASMPLEFYSPEAFGFLALFGIPHLALARAFLLWGLRSFILLLTCEESTLKQRGLITGVFWLAAMLAQPLIGLVSGAIPAAFLAVSGIALLIRRSAGQPADFATWKRLFKGVLWGGLIAGPFAVYNMLSFLLDPYLRTWNVQSYIPSAHPLVYLAAYGILLPFAIAGALGLKRRNAWQAAFLSAWVVLFWAAIYIPYSQQRRLLDGIWVGLMALTFVGLETNRSAQGCGRWLWRARPVLLATLIAPLLLMAGSFQVAMHPAPPAFVPRDQAAVFECLAEQGLDGEVALAAYATSNALPAWAPLRVVAGIGTLSAQAGQLQHEVAAFYHQDTTDEERVGILNRYGIRVVLWGPQERELGEFNPHTWRRLDLLCNQGEYQSFRVTAPNLQ